MIVCFSGFSGSGKTTIMEKVVKELSGRGWKVAAIKHTHHKIELDKKGKDTMRMRVAGANDVCIISKRGYFHFSKRTPSLTEMGKVFRDADIVMAEGFKGSGLNTIEVCDFPSITGAVAIVSDRAIETNAPLFRRNDYLGIADFIEKRFIR